MIPSKDLYVDAHDRLTSDPSKYAAQVAAKGCFLDDRTAKRYGITDALFSTDEPNAPAVRVRKIETEPEKIEEVAEVGPENDKPETSAKKESAKKGAKKK